MLNVWSERERERGKDMVVTRKIKTNKSKQTKPIEANWILEMILLIDRRWGNLLSHCLWHWLRFCGLFSITNNWLVIQSITKFGFWKIQMECISISCGFAKERTKKAIIDNLSCIIHQQLHIVRNPRFKWRSFTINPIHKWNKEFPQSVDWRSFATKKKIPCEQLSCIEFKCAHWNQQIRSSF